MVTTGGRATACALPSSPALFGRCSVLRQLLFEGDDSRLGAEMARHVRWPDSESSVWLTVAKTPRASRRAMRSLARMLQLLGQVLHADAFRNRDAARDGQRLARKRQPRRRNKALHRAFLHSTRNIALSRARGTASRTLSGRRRRSSHTGSGAESRTRSRRTRARRMRTTALTRPHWLTRRAGLGATPGRGRWKIGLPRSGITWRCGVAAAGRAGAE